MKGFVASVLLVSLLWFQFQPGARADWIYLNRDQMITSAQVIAIVTIGPIEKTKTQSGTLIYHQKGVATIDQILKGKPPAVVTIHAAINSGDFDACVPDTELTSGRCLVFLLQQGNLWVSANGDLGILPVKDGKIQWYGPQGQNLPHERKPADVSAVVDEIKVALKR